ncbi:peptidase associated/transthyretin-like domain-containing protein [Hymenobacter agri]
MRSALLFAAVLFTCTFGLNPAQARVASAAAGHETTGGSETPGVSKASEKTVLTGKITNAAGVLPGAVIILTATKQMAVTNAEGIFELVVPANSGPLDARVTYGGYDDEKMVLNSAAAESTVSLTNAHVVVVARSQRLERYLKTAHKQIKRELKQIRK